MEWEQETGKEALGEMGRQRRNAEERGGGGGGWQALLSAESDMAFGDR